MKLKGLVCGILCCVIALASFGCNRGGIAINEKQTQLYISHFDAGIGRTWVENLIDAFEEDFKDYSFEEGKKGVQVIPDYSTESGDLLKTNMVTSLNNVYLTESVDYYAFKNAGRMMDVTEIMEKGAITGVDANGQFVYEETAIKDKIGKGMTDFLNIKDGGNNAYYAFPFYFANKGVIYDRDLWNSKSLYFAKGACPSEKLVSLNETSTQQQIDAAISAYNTAVAGDGYRFVNLAGVNPDSGQTVGRSAGPDGVYNTLDDGLPATLDEFYKLMDVMVGQSITPFIWSGKSVSYADMIVNSFWQNEAGVDELATYYSLIGTANDLVVIDENYNIVTNPDGSIKTESMTFTTGNKAENGYHVQRHISKYYALQLAQKIARNKNWLATNSSKSHTEVQTMFLTSSRDNKPIAMLMDGAWWQQEAEPTFKSMSKNDPTSPYSKENRDFAMMSLPNSTPERLVKRIQNKEKNTLVSQNDSYIFLNNNMANNPEKEPQLKAAKAFVSYVNSDKALYIFSKATNMVRPVMTQFSQEQLNGLSKYGRNVVEYISNSNLVYPYSTNPFVNKNSGDFMNTSDEWNWHSFNEYEVDMPINYLSLTTSYSKLNAENYFTGLYKYYSGNFWNGLVDA